MILTIKNLMQLLLQFLNQTFLINVLLNNLKNCKGLIKVAAQRKNSTMERDMNVNQTKDTKALNLKISQLSHSS